MRARVGLWQGITVGGRSIHLGLRGVIINGPGQMACLPSGLFEIEFNALRLIRTRAVHQAADYGVQCRVIEARAFLKIGLAVWAFPAVFCHMALN